MNNHMRLATQEKSNSLLEKYPNIYLKPAVSIEVTPQDASNRFVLLTEKGKGEYNGKPYSVSNARDGSIVIYYDHKKWVLWVDEIVDQILPIMATEDLT